MFETVDEVIMNKDFISLIEGKYDDELFKKAQAIREENYKNNVYLRGIIDMSNYCMCSCKFCGNSCMSTTERYRLTVNQIIESIKFAQNDGIDLIHLAAGLDYKINVEYLEPIIEYCNANGINLEMAIGIKNIEVYKRIMDMGAKRFILKFETSNKDVFEDVKDCHCSFDDYIAFIKLLKKNGAHIGSGNIIGLPGTTIRDIANDIKLINDLDLNMISTSIFIPNKESVFANEKTGDRELALRYISIMTLLQRDRRISIPTNSSFGLNNKIKALKLGANVLSVNYTNTDYEKKYSIYDGAARYRADLDKTKNYIKQAGMDCISWREFKKNEPK